MAEAPPATPPASASSQRRFRPTASVYVPPSRRDDVSVTGTKNASQDVRSTSNTGRNDSKERPASSRSTGQPSSRPGQISRRHRRGNDNKGPHKKSQQTKVEAETRPEGATAGSASPPPTPRALLAAGKQRRGGRDTGSPRGTSGNRNKARNTESFEPSYESPSMRLQIGNPRKATYGRTVGVHDVILVPELLCLEDDTSVYENLLEELHAAQCDSLFVLWHGDSHTIADDKKMGGRWKKNSPTFQKVVKRMEEYFNMDIKATRFNWYKDSSDWKPYHHDRAAFTPNCPQNATVAASFGASRDVSFLHAKHGTTVRAAVDNGSVYAFMRDVNVDWKHGIMQEPPKRQFKAGRISIICWGIVDMQEWKEEMQLDA